MWLVYCVVCAQYVSSLYAKHKLSCTCVHIVPKRRSTSGHKWAICHTLSLTSWGLGFFYNMQTITNSPICPCVSLVCPQVIPELTSNYIQPDRISGGIVNNYDEIRYVNTCNFDDFVFHSVISHRII